MSLSLKGLNGVEIHNDLGAILKGEAKSYSTVTYYLHHPSFSSPKIPQPSDSPAAILNESDEAILLALSEEPFAWCGSLRAEPTFTLPSFMTTTHKLSVTVRYLHWVPHFLSEADKHR
jgi:hypothetical protein